MGMRIKLINMIKILFGEFNGVQVFLAPISLFYWIQSDTILAAGTSLLSFRIHYFPLLAFLIILCYTAFMVLKLSLLHHGSRSEFWDSVIDLHVSVLALVLIALILYALSGFIAYFYGIRGTLKTTMYMLFKLFTASIILYHYFFHAWLLPYYKRGYGRKRSRLCLLAWLKKNRFSFVRHSGLLLVFAFAAVRIYQLAIHFIISPALEGFESFTGLDLRLKLYPFMHIDDIFANVGVILLAFVLSNLLFFPLVYALVRFSRKVNPIIFSPVRQISLPKQAEEGSL